MDADCPGSSVADVATISERDLPPAYPGLSLARTDSCALEQMPPPPPYCCVLRDSNPPPYSVVADRPTNTREVTMDVGSNGCVGFPTVRYAPHSLLTASTVSSAQVAAPRRAPAIVQPNVNGNRTCVTLIRQERAKRGCSQCNKYCSLNCCRVLLLTTVSILNCPFFIIIAIFAHFFSVQDRSTGKVRRRYLIFEFVFGIIGILTTIAIISYFVIAYSSTCQYYKFAEACFLSRTHYGNCLVVPCCSSDSIVGNNYCYSNPTEPSSCRYIVLWTCHSDRYKYLGNCSSMRCCKLFETYDSGYCYYNASARMTQTSLASACNYFVNGDCYSGRYSSFSMNGCPSSAAYSFDKYCYFGTNTVSAPSHLLTQSSKERSTFGIFAASATRSSSASLSILSSSSSSCAYYSVYSLCFTNKRNARVYGNTSCTDVSYGRSTTDLGLFIDCCRFDEYFYIRDEYCYWGHQGGASNKSSACPYVAFGVCYSNRYFHGPCWYDACCPNDVKCNGSHGDIGNVTCQYSRCCALDETYYDLFCYYNGTEIRTLSDPSSYYFNSERYKGRYYTGPCQKRMNFCTLWGDVCYRNHCYNGHPIGF